MAIYKIEKKIKTEIDDIRLIRNPPRLLRSLAASILRLETLIKGKKIFEIEKISRYY